MPSGKKARRRAAAAITSSPTPRAGKESSYSLGYSILSRSRRTHTGRGYGQLLDELDVLVEHGHVVEARPPHFYADEVVGRVDAWEECERR